MVIALYTAIVMVTVHLISCMLLLYGSIMVSNSLSCTTYTVQFGPYNLMQATDGHMLLQTDGIKDSSILPAMAMRRDILTDRPLYSRFTAARKKKKLEN